MVSMSVNVSVETIKLSQIVYLFKLELVLENMSDLLLTQEKTGKFETMIENEIQTEFEIDADVTVNTNGKVHIREKGSDYKASSVVQNQYDELFDSLSGLDFWTSSSYEIITGEDETLAGASFYIVRDGW